MALSYPEAPGTTFAEVNGGIGSRTCACCTLTCAILTEQGARQELYVLQGVRCRDDPAFPQGPALL